MLVRRLGFYAGLFVAAAALVGCAGRGVLPAQSSAPAPAAGAQQRLADVCGALGGVAMLPAACDAAAGHPGLVPMVKYTFEFKNGTPNRVSWRRLDENCMTNNVPDVKDLDPGEKVTYAVDTNGGCCRCSHETSWFVLKFYTPNGDYRDVGFDKAVGKDWAMSNRGTNSDLYYCERLGGASINGILIRGNKCP